MSEIVIIRGTDEQEMLGNLEKVLGFLEQAVDVPLGDVAWSCANIFPPPGKACCAFIVDSTKELITKLTAAKNRITAGREKIWDKGSIYWRKSAEGATDSPETNTRARLAFVYPGVGSFYPDMLKELCLAFRICRESFEALCEVSSLIKREKLKVNDERFDPSTFIFPPAAYYRLDAIGFVSGGYAQKALSVIAANEAMRRLWEQVGIVPTDLVGFGGGEFNLVKRGKGVQLREIMGELYQTIIKAVQNLGLHRCVLYLVKMEKEKLDILINDEDCWEVMKLSPTVSIVAVKGIDGGEFLIPKFEILSGMRLEMDRPFNTPLAKEAVGFFKKFFDKFDVLNTTEELKVWNCATASTLHMKLRKAREECAQSWATRVNLSSTIRAMCDDGVKVFIEVGPRGSSVSAIDETLKGIDHIAIASDRPHRDGIKQFYNAMGQVAALGFPVDARPLFEGRHVRKLDFAKPLEVDLRSRAEQALSADFPRLVLFETAAAAARETMPIAEAGAAGKVAARRAAIAARERRARRFNTGAVRPLIADADVLAYSPGVSVEITKTFSFRNEPLFKDFALGAEQIAYSDPSLCALTLLPLPILAEIMAELATLLVPRACMVGIEELTKHQNLPFDALGRRPIFMRAQRTQTARGYSAAVTVQLFAEKPSLATTWPAAQATILFTDAPPEPQSFTPPPLPRRRDVHWMANDIYPSRLFSGRRLQLIQQVETWSEQGISYHISQPDSTNAVAHTRIPAWVINPLLLGAIIDGFNLYRSHQRFQGAFSLPYKIRNLHLSALSLNAPNYHSYLITSGVTPSSVICDINVTDGNGNLLLTLNSLEFATQRVDPSFSNLLLSPCDSFLSHELPLQMDSANSPSNLASAFCNFPTPLAQSLLRNDELFLNTLSSLVLSEQERKAFNSLTASPDHKIEWLFGRIAAKEAIRRFLLKEYQARWANADIEIWNDDSGKPHALGKWADDLPSPLELSISHTRASAVALVTSQALIGIDIEHAQRTLSDQFAAGVFSESEIELATQSGDTQTSMIRFWCAKETLSKALGTGIRWPAKDLVVTSLDPYTFQMHIELRGQWVEHFPALRNVSFIVSATLVNNYILTYTRVGIKK